MKTKLFFLFSALVAIDQIAKNHFSDSFCNKNIAWNIPIAPAIFYFAWTAVVAFLIYTFLKTKNYWQKLFFIFILAGAVSNIIDRIIFGCVVDYIDLKFFPVFNLADVYITIGIILVLVNIIKINRPA